MRGFRKGYQLHQTVGQTHNLKVNGNKPGILYMSCKGWIQKQEIWSMEYQSSQSKVLRQNGRQRSQNGVRQTSWIKPLLAHICFEEGEALLQDEDQYKSI